MVLIPMIAATLGLTVVLEKAGERYPVMESLILVSGGIAFYSFF